MALSRLPKTYQDSGQDDIQSRVPAAHVQEHEHLHSEALGMRSDEETAAEAATPHDASAPPKMHPAAGEKVKRLPPRCRLGVSMAESFFFLA